MPLQSLTVHWGSSAILTATLEDLDMVGQTGATVTVSITTNQGVAIITDAPMVDAGGGEYTYALASNALPLAGFDYPMTVTAIKDALTRVARATILVL